MADIVRAEPLLKHVDVPMVAEEVRRTSQACCVAMHGHFLVGGAVHLRDFRTL